MAVSVAGSTLLLEPDQAVQHVRKFPISSIRFRTGLVPDRFRFPYISLPRREVL